MNKGRNKMLITARDMRMYERYYYWTEVMRLRFDDAIRKLSEEEFFLSESRVLAIIRNMIQQGVSLPDGKQIKRPMFTGFKIKAAPQKVRSSLAHQPSLFPEYFQ